MRKFQTDMQSEKYFALWMNIKFGIFMVTRSQLAV